MVADALPTLKVDYSKYGLKHPPVAKAAVYALIKRGWEVESFNSKKPIGNIEAYTSRVEIDYSAFPVINISFLASERPQEKWLGYLEEDMLIRLFACVP